MAGAFAFEVTHRDGQARRGRLRTPHGEVETPAFMPVGTRAAVKAVTPRDLEDVGAAIILANTYHLLLRPGDELIARRGGLHAFMAWPRPILTDSGGYQVFSLGSMRRVHEEGVRFRSHLDGAEHLLTPERVVDVQARLGSDIAMILDECPPWPSADGDVDEAVRRTLRWAKRGRTRFLELQQRVGDVTVTNQGQAQFGIVQGGTSLVSRSRSAEETVAMAFEAYAIGGLSVGEPVDLMYDVVAHTTPLLPADRPRYLMGTGMPDDLVECVARGVDLFDCVLPTRNARNGQLFTREGPINIRNASYAEDDRPPDPSCHCYTCRTFTRAYLRHLATVGEMASATLNTLHNLKFYLDTLVAIRDAIEFGSFESFRQSFRRTFSRRLQNP